MRTFAFAFTCLSICVPAAAAQESFDLKRMAVYDRLSDLAKVHECDRLAAHSEDPNRVAEGVWKGKSKPADAVIACEVAVEDYPDSPRLLYQLGRAYSFADRNDDAARTLWRAVATGYPQALFSVGYFSIEGGAGIDIDACRGGLLLRRAAQTGHYGGLIAYTHFRLTEKIPADCADLPLDAEELAGFVAEARKTPTDFYRSALVDQLDRAVAGLPRPAAIETAAAEGEAEPDAPFGQ